MTKKPSESLHPLKDFEKNLGTLASLVSELESGDLSLEQSLKSFEKGIQLVQECQNGLNHAQQTLIHVLPDQTPNQDME
jgi:exodeoxyribonuclease VII small subunit